MTAAHTDRTGAPADHPGRAEIAEHFADRAAALDRGDADVRPGLRFLGERGLLELGAPGCGGDLATMLLLVEDVAAGCLSSAFSLWAQRMVVEYVARGPADAAAARELDGLRTGSRIGVTAMAPAMKHVAGIEPVPVLAERTGTGVRLTGPIRWASNLFDDALVVVPARFADGGGLIAVLRVGDPGVTVHSAPELLALGATGSSSVALTEVDVPAADVLSTDLTGFVRAVRPTFLLVQSAFCAGLAGASRRQAATALDGLNAEFRPDFDELAAAHDSVRSRLFEFARVPQRPADLLRLRLDAARTAGAASRLEAAVTGGRGYAATSPTSRRLREAAFLPIQAPTEGQLRWELSRSA
ncbi:MULTISPECIES: acyl-CoA dehydrogenase family protein [unclassified Saccharopolyspora]|uniref:acyl-CoA dehydrogenase family protein n=1 Tax=unclassified Saccharopolyspora TaxID=2646250 RepID=UPI001CD22D49|nr:MULTISPECIES: acyl-CoA dehydrogenase family protein [unclassified Saccharopolyspora]MCA1189441.1 acyl-CoA/acyl-ACP dehydrogenase [Saccharopolyspora sp. 6T]MCA1195883.1 acyl-CoA/acyl-ACP dehydrogenase [Saccharopolyspora sp. 6V]MCA1228832.1 acyl-CoA/acyl-ACP dehydrogenase [Saccharopolyspora sp. 6M]MCA1282728.1 acyl-CoA/acyl-ACP dehydrogenase [Saccharopolyspora sp. 7B]